MRGQAAAAPIVVAGKRGDAPSEEDALRNSVEVVRRVVSELFVSQHNQQIARDAGGAGGGYADQESLAEAMKVAELKVALVDLESRVRESDGSQHERNVALDELTRVRQERDAAENALDAVGRRADEMAVSMEHERDDLAEQVVDLQRQLDSERRRPHVGYDGRRGGGEVALAGVRRGAAADVNGSRMVQLERQVASFRDKARALETAKKTAEAKVDKLTRELKGTRPAPGGRAKVSALSRKAEEQEVELERSRAVQHELQGQVANLSILNADYASRTSELEGTLQVMEKTVDEMRGELSEADSRHDELCAQAAEAVTQAAEASTEKDKAIEELGKASEAIEEKDRECKQLRKRTSSTEQQLDDSEKACIDCAAKKMVVERELRLVQGEIIERNELETKHARALAKVRVGSYS